MPANSFQSMFIVRVLDISIQNKNSPFSQHSTHIRPQNERTHICITYVYIFWHFNTIFPSAFLNQIELEGSTEPKYIHCSLLTTHCSYNPIYTRFELWNSFLFSSALFSNFRLSFACTIHLVSPPLVACLWEFLTYVRWE